eukprot:6863645-Prymnesium_polylepis.1
MPSKLLITAAAPTRPGAPCAAQDELETTESSGTAVLRVGRRKGAGVLVSVKYATKNGSAIAGDDFVATSGSLDFPPNVTRCGRIA